MPLERIEAGEQGWQGTAWALGETLLPECTDLIPAVARRSVGFDIGNDTEGTSENNDSRPVVAKTPSFRSIRVWTPAND